MDRERAVAQRALIAGARSVNATLPLFSVWLSAGCGAAFVLVLVNIGTVLKFVSSSSIRWGFALFLASLALAVISRYLSTIIGTALTAINEGEAIAGTIQQPNQEFDAAKFAIEYERGLWPPARWFARASIKKATNGDIVAGARMVAKFSQFHGYVVFLQSVVAIAAVGVFAFGLRLPGSAPRQHHSGGSITSVSTWLSVVGIILVMIGAWFVAYEVVRKFEGRTHAGSALIGGNVVHDKLGVYGDWEKKRNRAMWAGLVLITLGSLLQIAGIFC